MYPTLPMVTVSGMYPSSNQGGNMDFLDSMGAVGGNILGSLASSAIGYHYNKKMSLNQYPWMMESMRRAGLNPILAYQKNANTPIMGSPQLSGLGSSAIDARLKSQQGRVARATENAQYAAANNYDASRKQTDKTTELIQEQVNSAKMSNEVFKANLPALKNVGDIKSGTPFLQWLDAFTGSALDLHKFLRSK